MYNKLILKMGGIISRRFLHSARVEDITTVNSKSYLNNTGYDSGFKKLDRDCSTGHYKKGSISYGNSGLTKMYTDMKSGMYKKGNYGDSQAVKMVEDSKRGHFKSGRYGLSKEEEKQILRRMR